MIIELVSDILDVGKMEAGNMKLKLSLCNPGDLFRNSIAIVESLKGQRQLSLDALGAEMDLQCDVELINRVLYNLLGNAIKFTTKTGTIRCGVEAGPKWVKFSISDDGSGIPIEYHKKIFEKYGQVEAYENQRKYSTGLGLTFCKMAVEAHGGQIGLESEVDKGSTFWFILPVSSIIQ
jgi:signal transduction histidine kinase